MNKRWIVRSILVIVFSLVIVSSSGQAKDAGVGSSSSNPTATNWYVSTMGNDSNSCTSASAPCATIQAANSRAFGGDTIYVAIGTYKSNGQGSEVLLIEKRLVFSGGWNESFSIQNSLSTIDGEKSVFLVNIEAAGLVVTLEHFMMTKSSGPTYGAITNRGKLLIMSSVVQNNSGSGIYIYPEGELTLIDSTVSNNGASWGGGIFNEGSATLIRSSVTHNMTSQEGGGIRFTGSSLILINSTVSNNFAQIGGGIVHQAEGNLSIYNSTIVDNFVTAWGGGIAVFNDAPISMQNSILANNRANLFGPDCAGTINSIGYNIIGDTTDCTFNDTTGDQLNTQPKIYPISTYYGLLPTSPAIDAGNPTGCLDDLGNPIVDDQRGSLRPLDGNDDGSLICDIGSFEVDPDHPIRSVYLPLCSRPCPILYFDDFSNPASGWPVDDEENVLVEYKDGEYRTLIRSAQYFVVTRPGFAATDYKVSVDLHNVTGTFGSYGIAFGIMQNWDGWYSLEIYPDGWFGIYRYDPSGGAVLADRYSPAIHQGTGLNHISVERNGISIKVYANGELLSSVTDSHFIGSLYLGLINYSYDQPNVDIRYDNFKVETLTCSPGDLSQELTGESMASWLIDQNNNHLMNGFSKHQP